MIKWEVKNYEICKDTPDGLTHSTYEMSVASFGLAGEGVVISNGAGWSVLWKGEPTNRIGSECKEILYFLPATPSDYQPLRDYHLRLSCSPPTMEEDPITELEELRSEVIRMRMTYCKQHGGSGYGEDCRKCYQTEIKASREVAKEAIAELQEVRKTVRSHLVHNHPTIKLKSVCGCNDFTQCSICHFTFTRESV